MEVEITIVGNNNNDNDNNNNNELAPQSTINQALNPQSPIPNQQSLIPNPQSPENHQSPISENNNNKEEKEKERKRKYNEERKKKREEEKKKKEEKLKKLHQNQKKEREEQKKEKKEEKKRKEFLESTSRIINKIIEEAEEEKPREKPNTRGGKILVFGETKAIKQEKEEEKKRKKREYMAAKKHADIEYLLPYYVNLRNKAIKKYNENENINLEEINWGERNKRIMAICEKYNNKYKKIIEENKNILEVNYYNSSYPKELPKYISNEEFQKQFFKDLFLGKKRESPKVPVEYIVMESSFRGERRAAAQRKYYQSHKKQKELEINWGYSEEEEEIGEKEKEKPKEDEYDEEEYDDEEDGEEEKPNEEEEDVFNEDGRKRIIEVEFKGKKYKFKLEDVYNEDYSEIKDFDLFLAYRHYLELENAKMMKTMK